MCPLLSVSSPSRLHRPATAPDNMFPPLAGKTCSGYVTDCIVSTSIQSLPTPKKVVLGFDSFPAQCGSAER